MAGPIVDDEQRLRNAQAKVQRNPHGRRCPGCEETLTLNSFGSDRNRRGGFQVYCLVCMCRSYLRRKNVLRTRSRNYHRQARQDVLDAYGRECKCCGETRPEFLAVDHVNNDGAKHRKAIGGGSRLSLWLRKNGFPEGFQILCHNCNLAKGFYRRCPHTEGGP